MLKIGDFSRLSRISIRSLRHYDDMGLLTPLHIDNSTNYRYYAAKQLPIANRITALKDMGFSLAVIGEILTCCDDADAFSQFLRIKYSETVSQASETEHRLRLLETAMKRLRRDDKTMKYSVILKELPSMDVASVRKTIPSYEHEGMLWGILMGETAPLEMKKSDNTLALAVFHDGEHKESNVDVEVQLSVIGAYPNTENVVFKTTPAVLIASATFKGSYSQTNEVNEHIAQWVQENGYEFDGLVFNIYHVSPHETKNPDEFVTEICYPVKKK